MMQDFLKKMPLILCLAGVLTVFLSACATNKEELGSRSEIGEEASREEEKAEVSEEASNEDNRNIIEDRKELGNRYYSSRSYDKAEEELAWVADRNPTDSDARYKLGVICCKEGMMKEGLQRFLEVISIDPSHSKAHYNIGAIYCSESPLYDPEKAVFFFKRYLLLEPDSAHREEIELWISEQDKDKNVVSQQKEDDGSQMGNGGSYKRWLKEQAEEMGDHRRPPVD